MEKKKKKKRKTMTIETMTIENCKIKGEYQPELVAVYKQQVEQRWESITFEVRRLLSQIHKEGGEDEVIEYRS